MIPFIIGKKVYLRGLEKEDLSGPMRFWANDRQVTRYLFRGAYPSTLGQLEQDYDAAQASTSDIEVAILTLDSDDHIGIAGLHSFSWVPRSAEFRILIGDKQSWGKGYGTEVAQLMVAYGFEIFNLNKVWLGVNSENKGAVRSYEKSGFVHEGELRDEVYRNSRYYNVFRMSILRKEYDEIKNRWDIAEELQNQFPA